MEVQNLLLIPICIALSACSSDENNAIDGLKSAIFQGCSESITLGDALENTVYCQGKEQSWNVFTTNKNETIVEFRCKKPQIEWFVQKDPITYYNDQFIGNEKMRNWYEKKFKWLLDFVNSLDPNSVTLKVQFSQSKKNKEEYTYYNTFLEYQNANGEAIATPFVTATEEAVSICDLYNDVRIIPNLKRFEELIKQRTK